MDDALFERAEITALFDALLTAPTNGRRRRGQRGHLDYPKRRLASGHFILAYSSLVSAFRLFLADQLLFAERRCRRRTSWRLSGGMKDDARNQSFASCGAPPEPRACGLAGGGAWAG